MDKSYLYKSLLCCNISQACSADFSAVPLTKNTITQASFPERESYQVIESFNPLDFLHNSPFKHKAKI